MDSYLDNSQRFFRMPEVVLEAYSEGNVCSDPFFV